MAKSLDDTGGVGGGGPDIANRRLRSERRQRSLLMDDDGVSLRRRVRTDAVVESSRAGVNAIRPSERRVPESQASRAAADIGRPPRGELSEGRSLVPEEVRQRFVKVGNKYHFPDGARAFTDHGKRLTSPSENTEVIKSLVAIAQARGWSDITVSGTERFRKEAWFAARIAGLDVRGYSPTDFEQSRLVRMLARSQAPESSFERPAAPQANHRQDSERGLEEMRSRYKESLRERSLQTGRLVDHGPAPYRHDARNDPSYFVRIETPTGEREMWGVDLQRALKQSLTRPRIGDEIGVRTLRREAVKIRRAEHDADGRVIGRTAVDAHRNGWIVEKREFFRERAQAARVLRDATVDRQQAVKQHPELLGTYLQLHAAELAAKTLRNQEDRQRFVASVRSALADSVARGEPLPPVPLKEPSAHRREGARSDRASPVRDDAPVR